MNYKNSNNLNSYRVVRKSTDTSVEEQTIIVLDADNSAFISEGDLNQMIADTDDIKAIFNPAK
jgi:hypothetical protein